MTIATGTITYGQTLNTGDYNSKKAEASFTFLVPEGGTAEEGSDIASALAQKKVAQMLGLSGSTAVEKKPRAKKAEPATVITDTAVNDTVTVGVDTVEVPQIRANPEDRKDPAAVEDDFTSFESTTPITDEQLRDACAKRAQHLKKFVTGNAPTIAIKKLIEKFCPPGALPGAAQIPAASRATFIKELDALTV